MKLLPNKTFPHPVLRKGVDDYVNREFQVTRDFRIDKNGVPSISVKFVVHENEICKFLDDKQAMYAVEIYCPMTLFRRVFTTHKKEGTFVLQTGELHSKVEVNTFIFCKKRVKSFHSKNFNKEFGENASFNLEPGDVLAATDTEVYHWDTELLKPITSVIELVASDKTEPGQFAVDTSEDRVQILMHPHDRSRFEAMRSSAQQKSVVMFVYFPAIVEVLQQMQNVAKDGGDDSEKRWYRAIEYRLNEMNQTVESMEPFIVAQKILLNPFNLLLTQVCGE